MAVIIMPYINLSSSWNTMYRSGCHISKKDIAELGKGLKRTVKTIKGLEHFPYDAR